MAQSENILLLPKHKKKDEFSLTNLGPSNRLDLTGTSINLLTKYQGDSHGGGFGNITHLGEGICLAGKWHWGIGTDSPSDIMYRSIDYGRTWVDVGTITGCTGMSTQSISQHNNVVMFTTGSHGYACVSRSNDLGLTWSVILSSSQVLTLCGRTGHADLEIQALRSVIYDTGNRWVICGYMQTPWELIFLESLDDGLTWNRLTTYGLPSDAGPRRMWKTKDRVFIFSDPDTTMYRSLDMITWTACNSLALPWTGFLDMGSGRYLAGTIGATRFTDFYIYKSIDYGITWTLKHTIHYYLNQLACVQTIVRVSPGIILAFYNMAGHVDYSALDIGYYSVSYDNGETWTAKGTVGSTPYGSLGAINDGCTLYEGTILLGCNNDNTILKSYCT